MKAVFFKDLSNYYKSSIVYVMSSILLLISGIMFFAKVFYYSESCQMAASIPVEYRGDFNFGVAVLSGLPSFVSFLLLFIIPFLTMRLFSEEKKLGTLELLFTYPITEFQLIFGKFFSCLLSLMPAIFISALLPLTLMKQIPNIEWGYIISGYLGVFLFCIAGISIGMWASTMTDNQLIAGIITVVTLILFWIIGLPGDILQGNWKDFFSAISFANNLETFMKASINLQNVVFFICITLIFIYLTYYNLSARKWRG
jgi:ABC-type Na+ efflux pump, permease component